VFSRNRLRWHELPGGVLAQPELAPWWDASAMVAAERTEVSL